MMAPKGPPAKGAGGSIPGANALGTVEETPLATAGGTRPSAITAAPPPPVVPGGTEEPSSVIYVELHPLCWHGESKEGKQHQAMGKSRPQRSTIPIAYLHNQSYYVSRAKWWTLKKCSHEFGPSKRIGRTAAVFYPDRKRPSGHHKKGRPSAATSHESRPGNPSFLHLRSPPLRPASNSEVEQITRNTGLGKPLGLYPNTSTSGLVPPPPLEWTSFPPLVTAV